MARAILKNDERGAALNGTAGPGKVLRLFAERIDHAATKFSALPVCRDQTFARSFVYSPETASLFERAVDTAPDFSGGNVQVLRSRDGWRTYNFEVENLHTYIAGNFRVHNDSAATLVVADTAYKNLFGTEFDATPESLDKLMGALSEGSIQAYGEYTALLSDDRYTTVAYDNLKDKIVMTIEEGEWNVTTWRDGLRQETRTIDPATGQAVMVHVGDMTTKLGDGAAGKATIAINEKQQIDYIITQALGKLNYTGAAAALGSTIGNAIAGDNFAAKVATSALLSTFLGKFAASLGSDPGGTKTIAVVGENGVINFDQIVTDTFATLGSEISANIRGQLVGALSSFLVAELAEALGLKDGVTKGVFTTVVGGVTTTVGQQLVENIVAMMDPKTAAATTLFKGFDAAKISGNIQNALGAYFGSELGKAIVTPKTPEAALFASAVASVMSTLLAGFPVIGPFIGSAIGQTVGAIIGRVVFDDDTLFLTPVYVDAATGALVVGKSIAKDASKNDKALGYNLAAQITNDINKFIVDNKFHIDTGSNFAPTLTGVFVNSHNEKFVSYNDQAVGSLDKGVENSKANIAMTLNLAEADVLKKLDLLITDPLIRRAYYASRDDGLTQLGTDLKVASDYLEYLQNPMVINAMIAQDKTSKFSVGWAITLLRAKELGLDRVSALDFKGGFYVNLKDQEAVQGPRGAAAGFAPERMAWTPDFEASDLSAGHTNSGSLLLRSPDKLSTVTIENVFAPGKLTSITGASGTATVDGRKASPGESSLVFIKAGDGDKTVYGAETWGSILVGGTGKQTLVGGAGNDWLRAGDGNVALIGGDGDDLLVAGAGTPTMDGGKGRNTYLLGPDGADVRISAIDANGSDTIVAVTAGARSENNIIDITARSVEGHAVYSSKTGVSPYEAKSGFSRSGTDLVITTVSGVVRSVNNTDENGNVISTEQQYTADTAKGKIIVKNFFLTDSGIDQIKFSDGTSFTNAEIWNEAKVTVRVDDKLWNSNENTSTTTTIDTTNSQANFFAKQTTTYNGNEVFVAFFNDDGTMWTNSFDPLANHDWQKWETAYKVDGTISAEVVTLDVKDASGNFVKISRGTGGTVAGGVGDDILRSAAAGSTLIGDRGDDDLTGAAGADLLYGGSGDDRYTVGAGDQVFEFAGQGNDVVEATVSYALAAGQSIEELRLAASTGTAALNLTGNELGNTLVGNAGINLLDGGAGNDVMLGGEGDDIYVVDVAGDKVQENAGEGIDGVRTTLTSYTLGAEIENLRYTGTGTFTGTGNSLANGLAGSTGADTLNGGAGNDTLDGGDGNDVLRGGTGDDTYRIDSTADQVFEAASQGRDTVLTEVNFTLAAGQEIEVLQLADSTSTTGNALTGNEYDNTLVGNAGANSLNGGGGDDTLDGSDGNDILSGGDGNDTYLVNWYLDQVFETADAGNDTVVSESNYTLAAGQEIETLRLTGTAARNLSGNEFANTLVGNAATNTLIGNDGDDTLDGAAGSDTLRGGLGNDIYIVDAAGDVVTEAAGEGLDEVRTILTSYTLGAEVEYLRYTGTAAFTGTGNALANLITGSTATDTLDGDDGSDTLNGAAGSDTMRGGTGNDIYIVDSTGDKVLENAGEGLDGVRTTLTTYTLGAEIENLRYTGTAAFTGTGNALANSMAGSTGVDTLAGGAGNDVLDGAAGDDILSGGAGDDTYVVDSADDTVTEGVNEGTDEVRTALTSYVLASNVETLRYTGSADFTGNGNGLANTLYGGAGDDKLDGAAGNDILRGGTGDDTYRVDNSGDLVFEATGEGRDTVSSANSFTLAAGQEIEVLELTGAGNTGAAGNEFGNTLIGNAGANGLYGNGGNDVIDGGDGGADTINGGDGFDTVSYASSSRKVTIALNDGLTWDGQTNDTLTSIENATGSAFNDSLVGDAGANVLDGAAGADTMRGGLGNDTYFVDATGDVVTENAGEGTDTIRTTLTSYTLGAEIENLRYSGFSAFTGTGNGLANALAGNVGNDTLVGEAGNDTLDGFIGDDVLDGGSGDDTMLGGLGNDTYFIDATGDVVTENAGAGIDTIRTTLTSYTLGAEIENLRYSGIGAFAGTGNGLANALAGNVGSDTLIGGAGNDTLDGFTGNDVLRGDAGSDTFQFRSALGSSNVDRIVDFVSGEDSILLENAYMTGLSTGPLAASAFKNLSQSAADADDRILYAQSTGELFYDADGSGSGAAVRFAILDNKAALSYQDFLVA